MATATSQRHDKPYVCPCGIKLSRKRDRSTHEKTKGHLYFVKTGTPNLINDKEGKHHAHHWTIETANGPFSSGMCKLCGRVQRFTNSLMNQGDWFRSGDDNEQNNEERKQVLT